MNERAKNEHYSLFGNEEKKVLARIEYREHSHTNNEWMK